MPPNSNIGSTGQLINQPIYLNGTLMTNPSIAIARQPYLLERHIFESIKTESNLSSKIHEASIGATLGLFINFLTKLIWNKIDSSIAFDKWELYAFILSLLIYIVTGFLGYFLPSERKKYLNIIETHFNNN